MFFCVFACACASERTPARATAQTELISAPAARRIRIAVVGAGPVPRPPRLEPLFDRNGSTAAGRACLTPALLSPPLIDRSYTSTTA